MKKAKFSLRGFGIGFISTWIGASFIFLAGAILFLLWQVLILVIKSPLYISIPILIVSVLSIACGIWAGFDWNKELKKKSKGEK